MGETRVDLHRLLEDLRDACPGIVEETIVIELKAVDKMLPVFEAQLLTYLNLSGYRVGLLINFNVPVLKDGMTRRVL